MTYITITSRPGNLKRIETGKNERLRNPHTFYGKVVSVIFSREESMLYSSKNAPTSSVGPKKSYDWFRRYGPVYEALSFAKLLCCTQSSARAIAPLSGDGGPHRKPGRGSAVSIHPFFLIFLLFSFIRRAFACSLLLFRLHFFAPALFARFFTISTCSSMQLYFDFEKPHTNTNDRLR